MKDLEHRCPTKGAASAAKVPEPAKSTPAKKEEEEDDGVDLFGSDSEEEDEEAKRVREQRLAEYAAKKSKSKNYCFTFS